MGLYYVAIPVMGNLAFRHMLKYAVEIQYRVTLRAEVVNTPHITLIPPFVTSYEEASGLNLKFAASTLLSSHPLTRVMFSVRGLESMIWENKLILHFPITIYSPDEIKSDFTDYINCLRKRISEGLSVFSWKNSVPEKWNPHITVAVIKDYIRREEMLELEKLIAESTEEGEYLLTTGHANVFAEYENGWEELSRSPPE